MLVLEGQLCSLALVLVRDTVFGRCRIDAFARLHLSLCPGEKIVVEIGVLLQIGGSHERAVPSDNRIDILQGRRRFGQSLTVLNATAAVVSVNKRDYLECERVASVHHASPFVCAGPK